MKFGDCVWNRPADLYCASLDRPNYGSKTYICYKHRKCVKVSVTTDSIHTQRLCTTTAAKAALEAAHVWHRPPTDGRSYPAVRRGERIGGELVQVSFSSLLSLSSLLSPLSSRRLSLSVCKVHVRSTPDRIHSGFPSTSAVA